MIIRTLNGWFRDDMNTWIHENTVGELNGMEWIYYENKKNLAFTEGIQYIQGRSFWIHQQANPLFL